MNGNGVHPPHHAVLFPFMSKGHTIPTLHLARLLLRRQIPVTVFTTPANRPFIASALPAAASIVELAFPDDIPGITAGVESTDKLPSMSLFPQFALSTDRLRPEFESAMAQLRPRPTFMVSDGFLWWTQDSAEKFGIPRLAFYGWSNHAASVSRAVAMDRQLLGPESEEELITVIQFPWIKVSKSDFEEFAKVTEPKGPLWDFVLKTASSSRSFGQVMNSFYELESVFVDYLNGLGDQKNYCVGPLCLAGEDDQNDDGEDESSGPMRWVEEKREEGKSVLYVAFGSQAEFSREQLEEIASGLEDSEVNFVWVIRNIDKDAEAVVRARVGKSQRGMVSGEWVNQRKILGHESVKGFMSHCGWNSVLEGVCAGVPILAWPMMAEQPLNARMVAEEIKVGMRVPGSGRDGRLVRRGAVEEAVRELMTGDKGKQLRNNVQALADKAKKSMEEGSGSSSQTLDALLRDLCNYKPQN